MCWFSTADLASIKQRKTTNPDNDSLMAEKAALVLLLILAGGLAIASKQPQQDVSLSSGSLLLDKINKVSIAEPQITKRSQKLAPEDLLKAQNQKLCKVCSHTNSSCECEVENDDGEVEDMEGFRNERCLLTMARSRGVLQDTLGRDLRVMTTEERLAEFKKRVDALRRRPSIESDQAKEFDRDSKNSYPDRDSAQLFVLPVSPYSGRKIQKEGTIVKNESREDNISTVTDETEFPSENISPFHGTSKGLFINKGAKEKDTIVNTTFRGGSVQEAFHKDGKQIIIEGGEEQLGTSDETKPPSKNISTLFDRTSGKDYLNINDKLKDTLNVEKQHTSKVMDAKPSSFSIVRPLRPTLSQIILPGSEPQPVHGPLDSAKPSGYSVIKLPAQFLSLTRLRERTVDIDTLPDDIDKKTNAGKEILKNLRPKNTIITPSIIKIGPHDSSQLPEMGIRTIDNYSSEISLTDKIVKTNSPLSGLKSSNIQDHKRNRLEVLESGKINSKDKKVQPILEGIVAIPKYININ
ncbi:uncharacterized protein LOC128998572 [Macrosteles quadrilineatus]|uniref:uncharacterized protein LOC128998572 n=1 Tax=Macrosteles quadrilineatus TaxID=74068 RepID=UPI0023E1AB89|nr:uncharacterized protein LOC128998572 [Macrosteles quadrilineatus]